MNWKNWLLLGFAIGVGLATLTVTIVRKTEKTPDPEEEKNVTKRTGPCRDNDTFDGCFWWRTVDIKFQKSEEICGGEKSKPAIIETEIMYEQLIDEVRNEINKAAGKSIAHLWTGMTFDPENGTVTTPDPCYVRWGRHNPKIGPKVKGQSHIAITIDGRPEEKFNGMFNDSPEKTQDGVVCQMSATSTGPK